MWLQPVLSPLARMLTRVYHRLTIGGESVPSAGPVLLVANHPNSLIDPAVVVGAAGRPVRFLAKHTLFSGEMVSWVVRGAGSIPIYRKEDAADLMHQNHDAFEHVFHALETGSAVGIFPEGRSHSESSLAPLKSGAARIALGAAARLGHAFPIIPIGLTFEERDTFRSRGLVVIGRPVEWNDLVVDPSITPEAIRDLTARIDVGLRRVTVNLERWDDAAIVHTAEEIITAETGADPGIHNRLLRLEAITDRLRELRTAGGHDADELLRELSRHDRRLRKLRLRPADLSGRPGLGAVARWTRRNIPLFGSLGLAAVAIGSAILWPPYKLVEVAESRARPLHDVRSTYKLAAGVVLFTAWWAILIGTAGWIAGWRAAVAMAIVLPLLGLATLDLQERWSSAIDDARNFWLHRTRPAMIAGLAARQKTLAERLDHLFVAQRSS